MSNFNLENLICPITRYIFNEPVTLSDGQTYEKDIIIEWLKINNKSPITNKIINDDVVNCEINNILKNIISDLIISKIINQEDVYLKKLDIADFFHKYGTNDDKVHELIDLMESKGLLNTFDSTIITQYNYQLIHWVCRFSSNKMIKYLIDKNINLEAETIDKWRPIHLLCKYQDNEIIQYLINKNVKLETETSYNCRPIHLICEYQNNKMIQIMIDKNILIDVEMMKLILNNTKINFINKQLLKIQMTNLWFY